jgi:hypothetical protein
MLRVIYAEFPLLLSVTCKPFMLSIVMLCRGVSTLFWLSSLKNVIKINTKVCFGCHDTQHNWRVCDTQPKGHTA